MTKEMFSNDMEKRRRLVLINKCVKNGKIEIQITLSNLLRKIIKKAIIRGIPLIQDAIGNYVYERYALPQNLAYQTNSIGRIIFCKELIDKKTITISLFHDDEIDTRIANTVKELNRWYVTNFTPSKMEILAVVLMEKK